MMVAIGVVACGDGKTFHQLYSALGAWTYEESEMWPDISFVRFFWERGHTIHLGNIGMYILFVRSRSWLNSRSLLVYLNR